MKAAIVGFGAVARHGHLPWYLKQPSVNLVAVVEPTANGRAAAQALLPGIPMYATLEDLLAAQSVAFVDITAPPVAHSPLVRAAAAAGVHVICEKPFVTSWSALQAIASMMSAQEAHKPIIAACHNWSFAPAIRHGLGCVAAGLLGEPSRFCFTAHRTEAARGSTHWKPMWRESAREGGGIIGDLGYHGIYLASRIFRQAPLSVRATASRVAAPEEEDGVEHVASLDLNYGNGRQAELTLSWLSDRRETTLDIYGSRGSLRISGDTLSLNIHGRNAERMQFESLIADSWHSAWTSATLDWFLDLLSSGARGEAWQEIAWTVSALDAAYTSVATGGVVATATQVAGHPPIHGR